MVHSMTIAPANHHDITEADKLLHGEEEDIFADSGYLGIEKRPEHQGRKVNWYIAMTPGKRKQAVRQRESSGTAGAGHGQHPSQSRVSLPDHQAAVWIYQDPLSGHG